jgi:pimeloyl-ACP methyl ester carboxylesterase
VAETAVVLVHGWCCHAGFWRHQVDDLAPGRDVVTVDLGQHRGAPTIAAFADAVCGIAGQLPHPALALVGHSMGGPVAFEAAVRLGGRCRLLLGVDTFTDAAFYGRRPEAEIETRMHGFAGDFAATMQSMVARIMAPDADPALVGWVTVQMATAAPDVALAALRSLLAWDIGTRWPARPCAVETINSAWLDTACEQVAGLDGLRVHALDGVGHFPMLEAPARFNALARAILARHLGPAHAA